MSYINFGIVRVAEHYTDASNESNKMIKSTPVGVQLKGLRVQPSTPVTTPVGVHLKGVRLQPSTPIAKVAPELKQYTGKTGITKTCAILGCEDSKNLSSEEFFRFPEDPDLRLIWTSLTGRNNWTPTDYSYICVQHFSVDCFYCNEKNQVVLTDSAVPSLKLPRHVFEVEYIDEEEEYLDNDNGDVSMEVESELYNQEENENQFEININQQEYHDPDIDEQEQHDPETTTYQPEFNQSELSTESQTKSKEIDIDVLKLFTEVQKLQRQATSIKSKLKLNQKIHNRQSRFLNRMQEIIEMKKKLLEQKKKKKARILLSLQDKIREDTTGLVMAMPMRYTDDLKNFALCIYKYSPQAYIYTRNSLRTLLPSTDLLEAWLEAGFMPKNVLTSGNMIRVTAEQNETELSCKVSLN